MRVHASIEEGLIRQRPDPPISQLPPFVRLTKAQTPQQLHARSLEMKGDACRHVSAGET